MKLPESYTLSYSIARECVKAVRNIDKSFRVIADDIVKNVIALPTATKSAYISNNPSQKLVLLNQVVWATNQIETDLNLLQEGDLYGNKPNPVSVKQYSDLILKISELRKQVSGWINSINK